MNLGITWKLPPGNLIACCSEWPPDRALGRRYRWLAPSPAGRPDRTPDDPLFITPKQGTRPLIELEPAGHPLDVEQRTGIRLARVQVIAEPLLHGLPDAG